jgi:hypothetical protein
MLSDHYIPKIVIYNWLKKEYSVYFSQKTHLIRPLLNTHNFLAFNELTLLAPLLFSLQEVQK